MNIFLKTLKDFVKFIYFAFLTLLLLIGAFGGFCLALAPKEELTKGFVIWISCAVVGMFLTQYHENKAKLIK